MSTAPYDGVFLAPESIVACPALSAHLRQQAGRRDSGSAVADGERLRHDAPGAVRVDRDIA
jgi:hypothetical protein